MIARFSIAWAVKVEDAFAVESRIHAALIERRTNPRREFFRVTPQEARDLLALVARAYVEPDAEPVRDEPALEPVLEAAREPHSPMPFETCRFHSASGTDALRGPTATSTIAPTAHLPRGIGPVAPITRGSYANRDFRRCNCVLPPGAQHIEGSLMHQAIVAQTPEGKLRAWVEENYTHVPLREKDIGTKLEVIYTAYTAAVPPVHTKTLGRNTFGKMLNAVYPSIGPHKNSSSTVFLYLLR
jgi:hypothetical protein